MKLSEVLKKFFETEFTWYPDDMKWTYDFDEFFTTPKGGSIRGDFTVGDTQFHINISKQFENDEDYFELSKYLTDEGREWLNDKGIYIFTYSFQGPTGYSATGLSKHTGQVFSTMVNVFRKIAKATEEADTCYLITFSAVDQNLGRIGVYETFSKHIGSERFIPGMKFIGSVKSGSSYVWYVGREDHEGFFNAPDAKIGKEVKLLKRATAVFKTKDWEKIQEMLDSIIEDKKWSMLDEFGRKVLEIIDRSGLGFVEYAISKLKPFVEQYGGVARFLREMIARVGLSGNIVKSIEGTGDLSGDLYYLIEAYKNTPEEERFPYLEWLADKINLKSFYRELKSELTDRELSFLEEKGLEDILITKNFRKAFDAIEAGNVEEFKQAIEYLSDIEYMSDPWYENSSEFRTLTNKTIMSGNPEMIKYYFDSFYSSYGESQSIDFFKKSRLLIQQDVLKWFKENNLKEKLEDYLFYNYDSLEIPDIFKKISEVFDLSDFTGAIEHFLNRNELKNDDAEFLESTGNVAIKIYNLKNKIYASLRDSDNEETRNRLVKELEELKALSPEDFFGFMSNNVQHNSYVNDNPDVSNIFLDASKGFSEDELFQIISGISYSHYFWTRGGYKWLLKNNINLSSLHKRIKDRFQYIEKDERIPFLNKILKDYDMQKLNEFYNSNAEYFTPEEKSIIKQSGKVFVSILNAHVNRIDKTFRANDLIGFKKVLSRAIKVLQSKDYENKENEDYFIKYFLGRLSFRGAKERIELVKYFIEKIYKTFGEDYLEYIIEDDYSLETLFYDVSELTLFALSKGITLKENRLINFVSNLASNYSMIQRPEKRQVILKVLEEKLPENIFNNFIYRLCHTRAYEWHDFIADDLLTLYNNPKTNTDSKAQIIATLFGYDNEKVLPLMRELPSLLASSELVTDNVRKMIVNYPHVLDNKPATTKSYTLFTMLPDSAKKEALNNWTYSYNYTPTQIANTLISLISQASVQKNLHLLQVLFEYITTSDLGMSPTVMLQKIVKNIISIEEPFHRIDYKVIIPYLEYFRNLPLFHDYEKKFRLKTPTTQYPPEFVKALIFYRNISPEQLTLKARRELGIESWNQPELFASPEMQSQAPPEEVIEKAKKARNKLRELLDFEIENIRWSVPLQSFVRSGKPSDEYSSEITQARVKIRGQEYIFKITKRMKEPPRIDSATGKIKFYEYEFEFTDALKQYRVTGGGNAPLLFSAMVHVIKKVEVLTRKTNVMFSFESVRTDKTRVRLYNLFAMKVGKVIPELIAVDRFITSRGLMKWVFVPRNLVTTLKPYTHELAESKEKTKKKLTINEVLDSPVTYKEIEPTEEWDTMAEFEVGDMTYRMAIAEEDINYNIIRMFLGTPIEKISNYDFLLKVKESGFMPLWFLFYAIDKTKGGATVDITGTGHTGQVFTNVVAFLSDIFKYNKNVPCGVTFSGKEPSRIKLYNAFYDHVSRFIPGVFPVNKTENTWVIGNKKLLELRRKLKIYSEI